MWEHNISSLHLQLCGHIWSSENVPSMFERFCAATTSGCLMLIGEWLLQFHFSHQRVQKPQQVHTEHSYLPWVDRLWVFSHVYQAPTSLLPPSISHLGLPGSKHFPPQVPGSSSQVSSHRWPGPSGSHTQDVPGLKYFAGLTFQVLGNFSASGSQATAPVVSMCRWTVHLQSWHMLPVLLPALVFIKWCTFA